MSPVLRAVTLLFLLLFGAGLLANGFMLFGSASLALALAWIVSIWESV